MIKKRRTKSKTRLKVAVLVEKSGKLLLIRERLHRDWPYRWNMVKGSFEPEKDRDFVSAARRECSEEACARVNITKLQNVLYLYRRETNKAFVQFNFVGKLVGSRFGVPSRSIQKKHSEDIVDVRLFNKSELRAMKKSEFIGERAYSTIHEWLRGAPRHSLESLKRIAKF